MRQNCTGDILPHGIVNGLIYEIPELNTDYFVKLGDYIVKFEG